MSATADSHRISVRGAASIDGYWIPTVRDRLANRAHGIVNMAIKRGLLPDLDGLRCMDCNAPAEHYDHRNYYEPLKVEPVCRGCNIRRGPALPLPTERDGGAVRSAVKGSGYRWNGMAGDAEGYVLHELPLHADVDWKELAESVDETGDRRANASAHRQTMARQTRRSWVKTARYEYFKSLSPWALTEVFGEFA